MSPNKIFPEVSNKQWEKILEKRPTREQLEAEYGKEIAEHFITRDEINEDIDRIIKKEKNRWPSITN